MTLHDIDQFCGGLTGCTVRYPFDTNPGIRAWCIGKRMFAWTNTRQHPVVVQLKAHPDLVPMLIESYSCVHPGYHMNKRHWISVDADTCEPQKLIGLLEDAHHLVANALSRAEQMRLLSD